MHEAFHVEIPDYAMEGLKNLSEQDPHIVRGPMSEGLKTVAYKYEGQPNGREKLEVLLNTSWRPQLTVIGLTGLPSNLAHAGNVIRKEMTVRCSMRLAPTHKADKVVELLREHITRPGDDTFGA